MDREATGERLAGTTAEEGLVRGLKAGDEAAFEELWQRFGAGVHGYAASCLGDEDLADDVTAQCLAAAVQCIGRFDPRKAALSTWMYGIARRVIQGELRAQRRRKSVPLSAQVPLGDASDLVAEGDSAEMASRIEAKRKVGALASALSPAEMEVLVLHFVDEFSVREIARIVGRSWRAVDSLIYRAKEKARERLANDGE
jgi:RNA polymerase sigma-70 factor (ECF subfamily)